jgi:hypothetical protein
VSWTAWRNLVFQTYFFIYSTDVMIILWIFSRLVFCDSHPFSCFVNVIQGCVWCIGTFLQKPYYICFKFMVLLSTNTGFSLFSDWWVWRVCVRACVFISVLVPLRARAWTFACTHVCLRVSVQWNITWIKFLLRASALRVLPVETRLTVYRRYQIRP